MALGTNHSVALGVNARADTDEVIALGRSQGYTSGGDITGHNGSYIKLPVRGNLHNFDNGGDHPFPTNGNGELLYEGMMCIYRPNGPSNDSGAHIAIYFNGGWQRLDFSDLPNSDIINP